MYALELNERIKKFDCPHCGEESLTVWGFVSRDHAALAIYYAGLMTGHQQASARLTISFGGWGTDQPEEDRVPGRFWVFIEARPIPGSTYEMMVREPEESLYFGKDLLGAPLTRAEALASPFIREIWAVADFIAQNDPAVMSYLKGRDVSSEGRSEIQ
ncbi:MAG TPA: hypothetical protein VGJ21_17335 [Terracidiphilus sp.]|jgi:hypothetical protein